MLQRTRTHDTVEARTRISGNDAKRPSGHDNGVRRARGDGRLRRRQTAQHQSDGRLSRRDRRRPGPCLCRDRRLSAADARCLSVAAQAERDAAAGDHLRSRRRLGSGRCAPCRELRQFSRHPRRIGGEGLCGGQRQLPAVGRSAFSGGGAGCEIRGALAARARCRLRHRYHARDGLGRGSGRPDCRHGRNQLRRRHRWSLRPTRNPRRPWHRIASRA